MWNQRIIAESLHQGWKPVRIGRRILTLAETASTNTVALDMAGDADADGLVVFADYQNAGRGRQGHRWVSPRGASILSSVLLILDANTRLPAEPPHTSPGEPAHDWIAGRLILVSAVAACEAIARATELRTAIKWPNDIRIDGRKLGGILIESRPLDEHRRAWVLGFGINCLQHAGHFPPELTDTATSLEIAASHAISRVDVARALLATLDEWLAGSRWQDDEVHRAWQEHAEPTGGRITLKCQGEIYAGRTLEVDPLGGLTVQLDHGRPKWFDPILTSVL